MSGDEPDHRTGGAPKKRGSEVSRRRLLLAGTGAAGLVVGAAATETRDLLTPPAQPDQVMQPVDQIPPSEDLMREHGVLKRILLAYREVIDRLHHGRDVPADALHQAATIVHDFIEGFHEGLEEAYVFPRLQHAGKHVDVVQTLLVQHARGRRITQQLLTDATAHGLDDADTRGRIADNLAGFVGMYEPHDAREDTTIVPTFREITPDKQFAHLGEHFADLEAKQFGRHAFDDRLTRVTQIETSLGIHDLAQFTPPP
ncbi:MAG: hemerythrin domain-containing protein [Nocardioidaceae bacterium]